MAVKTMNRQKRKLNGNSFLLLITVLLFVAMYVAGMIVFADKGFAKPQMFLNLFISNAGLLVIAMGQTIVMITHDMKLAAQCDRVLAIVDGRLAVGRTLMNQKVPLDN